MAKPVVSAKDAAASAASAVALGVLGAFGQHIYEYCLKGIVTQSFDAIGNGFAVAAKGAGGKAVTGGSVKLVLPALDPTGTTLVVAGVIATSSYAYRYWNAAEPTPVNKRKRN